jgi:hypothetical protein
MFQFILLYCVLLSEAVFSVSASLEDKIKTIKL